MKWKKSLWILGCWAMPLFAQSVLPVTDHASVTAHIAGSDINRIAIEGERIKSVRGLENHYTVNADLQTGEIYVKPLLPSQPFNLFLTTETNKTYQVQMVPTLKTAATVLLKPMNNVHTSTPSNALSAYEAELIQWMEALTNSAEAEGDPTTVDRVHHHSLSLMPGVTLTKIKSEDKGMLQGDVYLLRNESRQTLALTEQQFYRPHTLAIALQQSTLLPHQLTYLYTVRHHG